MSTTRLTLFRLFLLFGFAAGLNAQFAFTYRTSANPTPATIDNNGSLTFPATAVGNPSTVTLIGRNTTAETWNINSLTVSNPVFQLGQVAQAVQPGSSFLLNITFTPSTAVQVTGTLSLRVINTAGTATTNYTFFLFAGGQAPQLIASYIINPDGNQTPLGDADTIAFPQTAVRGTATATFIVVNRGNGAGTLRAVTLSGGGDAFRLSGLPLLPAQVAPDRDVRFTIVFSPPARDSYTGALRVELGDRTLNITLAGQGAGATFSYEFVTSGGTVTVQPEGTIRLPGAAVGATSSGVLRIRNTGNADARVAAVSVTGTVFRVTDLAPLPVTLTPGAVFSFTVQFTPTTSGLATTRLLVDAAAFTLEGTGTGSRLNFFSRIGTTVAPIPEGGSVTFPNTTVGQNSSVTILVVNEGNAAGTLSGIGATPAVFTLSSLPALPATIAPEAIAEFQITFTPNAVGSVTGTLQVDDRAIGLRGVGNAPPALPGVTLTGVNDTGQPLEQPSVGLRLAEPYALDVTGKLTLSFTPDSFVDDPSIQFATGGRTVDFRIPANTTEAIFGESARSVPFQAGTVAGVISVGATFAAGAANVTPNPAPAKSLVIASAAPQIRNVQGGARTATSFELLITGLSTARSMTQFNLSFTGAPGASLGTTSMSINVEAPFTSWYQGATGRSFGSQFTASVIINVTGDVNAVQSVSVTASNSRGASNTVSANLR